MAASPFEDKAMHVPCWYSTHLHVVFHHLIESYSVQVCYCSFNADMLLDGIYPDRALIYIHVPTQPVPSVHIVESGTGERGVVTLVKIFNKSAFWYTRSWYTLSLRSCPLPIIPLRLSQEEGMIHFFDCKFSFRNLRIILSDLRFHNTFQFVKYGASA